MPNFAGVDVLLDHLLSATQALRVASQSFVAGEASDLLARRRQLVASLSSAVQKSKLTAEQILKLEQAIQLGDEARQALLIKRETSRCELQEKLAGRHFSESFKPYRPKKLGSLNIKL
jgi:hypothetical protein